MGLNLRKRIGVMVLSLRLFLALVTSAISSRVIVEKGYLLAVLNGAVIVRNARGSEMKRWSNPEAVMHLGAGIIIVIGVIAGAIIYLCM